MNVTLTVSGYLLQLRWSSFSVLISHLFSYVFLSFICTSLCCLLQALEISEILNYIISLFLPTKESQTYLTAVVKEHFFFTEQFPLCFRNVVFLSSPVPLKTASHKGDLLFLKQMVILLQMFWDFCPYLIFFQILQ